ncbi:siderophore-interacting protein [Cellulomonas sp. SG140]|uniref:siderophore-interacting protein n=1 Tax=Cellulomonas sp. SG140 TaxID=2976536 RepID=UPI0021E86F7F|nr:siderophore-interacting protein [Cellulomonas sp. SG140]
MPSAERPEPFVATVVRAEQLSRSMLRVVLGGRGLTGFAPNGYADQYVKLLFPRPGQDRPARRTYTVRAWDGGAGQLTVDVAVHGDQGLAGPWAVAAQPGDQVLLTGPGGGYSPEQSAAWHLLIGDESSLPAIAVAVERLAAGAVARALIEVEGPHDEVPLEAAVGADAQVVWLHRDGRPRGELLVETVTAMAFPVGDPQVFLHGEAGFVRTLRRHLLAERHVPRERAASISGYWRLGRDDEGWRAEKAQWKADVEADVPTS